MLRVFEIKQPYVDDINTTNIYVLLWLETVLIGLLDNGIIG